MLIGVMRRKLTFPYGTFQCVLFELDTYACANKHYVATTQIDTFIISEL